VHSVLITGAKGFIGTALCSQLASDGNTIIGVDITKEPDKSANIIWEQADLTDGDSVAAICERHSPDVVIHCAGICAPEDRDGRFCRLYAGEQ